MTDHPPDDVLRSYLDGRLPAPEAGPVEDHVDGCEACARRLDQLVGGGDTFQERVRNAAAALTATVERPDPSAEAGPGPDPVDGDAMIDTVVAGRYKIRQVLGEGGMGCVYLADQAAPVRRQVALKLIRPGMDSRTVLARFDSERQALALMDHPHIAKVLDAGTTDRGRPFFVMELVRGVPLTDYCDAHRIDLPARLCLFRQICSAVQHAHQKGIIHRDLKPSNILVESHDERPVPKVIDFGLAKATSGLQLTEQSLYTAFGSVAGTPLYMAPEQASFNALDIDTRADIYALGVILYELLTGSTPIRRESLHRAAVDEMLRLVREGEPPTPSHRVSSSEGRAGLAAMRRIEPGRWGRFIRGELDWIVMKALAKERDRRYESAIGLANDVGRFLDHEPVQAGPPTAGYRIRKFIRRHRGQAVAAGVVLVTLVVGIVGTTLGLIRARDQERIASAAALREKSAREAEAVQRRQAEKRLAQNGKIIGFLGSTFQDLDPQNTSKDAKPLAAVLGEHLVRAADQIEGEAIGDPLVVAGMQRTLGMSLLGLGHFDEAIRLLAKSRSTFVANLGAEDPEAVTATSKLATALWAAGRSGEATPLAEEALRLDRLRKGPDHRDTLASMNDLATVYRATGRLAEALTLLEETLAAKKARLGPDDLDTLATMNNLANAYRADGRAAEAVPLLERVLGSLKAKLGPDHPDTIATMGNLAIVYQFAGKAAEAVPLAEETLRLVRSKLGADHPDTLTDMNTLAAAYQATGRSGEAVSLCEQALALEKVKLGPDHPNTLRGMGNLAATYLALGRSDEGLALLAEVLRLTRAKRGTDHPDTLAAMISLADSFTKAGREAEGVLLLREVADLERRKSGPDSTPYAAALARLATGLLAQGEWAEAEPAARRALAIRERAEPDEWRTWGTKSLLGGILLGEERYDEAEPLLVAGYRGMDARAATIPGEARARVAEALDRLIALAEATGKPDEARRWREEKARWATPATTPGDPPRR